MALDSESVYRGGDSESNCIRDVRAAYTTGLNEQKKEVFGS
jgi:hypothetical protein